MTTKLAHICYGGREVLCNNVIRRTWSNDSVTAIGASRLVDNCARSMRHVLTYFPCEVLFWEHHSSGHFHGTLPAMKMVNKYGCKG